MSIYPSDSSKQHYTYLVYESSKPTTLDNLIENRAFRSEKRVKEYFKSLGIVSISNPRHCYMRINTDKTSYDVYKILRGVSYNYEDKVNSNRLEKTKKEYEKILQLESKKDRKKILPW